MPSLVSSDRVMSFKDLEVLVIKLLNQGNVLKPVPPIEAKRSEVVLLRLGRFQPSQPRIAGVVEV